MSTTEPLVSLIILSYNYGQYIGQTIRSVLAQTFQNWELIISDDGSTDNSLEVIGSFTDSRIRLNVSGVNEGASASYNKAYGLCRGKYFASLDADDYIAADKLNQQVQYLEAHPEIDILGTFVLEVDDAEQPVGAKGQHQIWFNQAIDFNLPDSWLWQNHLCHSSVLMRNALHGRVGPYNTRLICAPDYEFWVRCLIAGGRFHVLSKKLTYYRAHGDNVSHKDPLRSLIEVSYIQTVLKSYLLKINRSDLVDKAIHLGYEQCCSSRVDNNLTANILDQLLFPEDGSGNFERFQEDVCSPARPEALIVGKAFESFYGKIRSLEAHVKNLEQALGDKEAHIGDMGIHIGNLESHIRNVEAHAKNLEQALGDKEAHIGDMGIHIGNLESHIRNVEAHAKNLEQALGDKEAHIGDMGIHIGNLESHIRNVEAHAKNLEQALGDKEAHIGDMGIHIGNLESHIRNVEAHATNLEQVLADKDSQINNLEGHASNLTQAITLKESQIQGLESQVAAIESHIRGLEHTFQQELDENSALKNELREIKNSLAWTSILKYRGLRDRVLPLGTRRRHSYDFVKHELRALVSPKAPGSDLTHGAMPKFVGEAFNSPPAGSLDQEPAAKAFLGKKLEYRPSAASLKIACLTWTIPYPPDSGGKNRSYNLLRYLARHHEVHLHVPFWEVPNVPPDLLDIMASITIYQLSYSFSPKTYRSKIVRGVPSLVAGFSTTESVAEFQQKLTTEPADLILIDEAPLAAYAWSLSEVPCILMRQKVDYLFYRDVFLRTGFGKEKAKALREWVLFRLYENKLWRRFRKGVVVSEMEREIYLRLNPALDLAVIPNGVDILHFRVTPLPTNQHPTILLNGTMSYQPNVDAAGWFVEKIFPLIVRRLPKTKLLIVGQNPVEEVQRLARSDQIIVTGSVPDMRDYLNQSNVVVVPLRIGHGTRLKILEAMAAGRPVVSTSIGAEGLEAQAGKHLLLGDNPAHFAANVIEILSKPRLAESIASDARQFVENLYSWPIIGEKLSQYCQLVANSTVKQ